MTIRKNFNFDKETAQASEQIAKEEGITQTETVKLPFLTPNSTLNI